MKQNFSNYIPSGNPAADSKIDEKDKEDEEDIEFDDWFVPINISEKEPVISLNSPQYGFGNKISRALDAFEVNNHKLMLFF